ncbi:4-coumarate--CoA ligase 1-like [Bradysia coprophila]|uniref:4-coumarate--CoA ligase 1-like n=1 Tax=Bradysia coprophila TaxID=38358 RepID=UPI00187DBB5B|nr:4-coumarate--CoA ligase 1-like [Bradysia coprophila]XP_037025016.1 4-coumarate--CoA ligase 1-like [Bradysia coprophila]
MQFENNIIHRPETSNLYCEQPSLAHLIIKNLTSAGDKTLIVCGITGKEISARELLSNSIQIAKALTVHGIRQGDVVSIISENRFEFVYALLGTIFLNCTVAPLNHTYSQRELEHALNLSKPKFVFTGGSTAELIVNIAGELNYVKKIILFDDNGLRPTNGLTVSLQDFTSEQSLRNVQFKPLPVNVATSTCVIMCSSGTTGLPKGVQISQSGIIVTARQSKEFLYGPSNVGDADIVILGLLPMFHVFGAAVLICTIVTLSGKIIMLPKFEEVTFLGCIEKYRCSVAFLVPPLMVFLAKNSLVDKYDLSSLRFIMSGAAPLSKELEQSVKDRLQIPNLVIKQGYGMTELTVSVLSQKDFVKSGSVGDINSGAYVKVCDDAGNALGPNQVGELCFKGSTMMIGYIGDKAATSAMIDSDGWLHTGDVGYYDNDLQFFIVDRIKELIKCKGFQVPPAEIEALLLTHPKIKDCGVIGKPDEMAGELPLAFIVRNDPNLTKTEILKYVSDKASPAKRLHGGVIFVDEIPKNPSGKILRRQLREQLAQLEMKSKL